ncbi:hypothetical protein C8F04DRAFT_1275489 [Mycena alexandri]|uniref:Uncharacterized protein n=1 Tax=Mycena alexandri TaxID=1745969 RepID=A0AAD6S2P3_9AGAR|nr:hypothetical protein C8F04DRAFT_1275489 [Mycena alexandri]
MADYTLCLGEQPDGRQCICRRYTPKPNQPEDGPDICKNCNHMASSHPLPTPSAPTTRFSVADIVKDFRDAGKVQKAPAKTSELKASSSVAHAETSEGLRKKRKSDTDTEPQVTHKKNKKDVKLKAPVDTDKKVSVGTVILKPEGLLSEDKRFKLAHPLQIDAAYIDRLCSVGLGKMVKPGEALNFYRQWSPEEVTDWLRILFPEALKWLEAHPYQPEADESNAVKDQVWRLCIKTRSGLSLSHEPFPSGVEMSNACVAPGRSAAQRLLVFTSKREIPEERYNDWEAESDDELSAESSNDVLSIDGSPKKFYFKSTPKIVIKKEAVAAALAPAPPTVALAPAASTKMATRLATGTIEKKTVYVPDSDDEDYFPSSVSSSPVAPPLAAATQPAAQPAPAAAPQPAQPAAAQSTNAGSVGPSGAAPAAPPLFGIGGDNPYYFEPSTGWIPFSSGSPIRRNTDRAEAALAAAVSGASSSDMAASSSLTSLGFHSGPRPDPW